MVIYFESDNFKLSGAKDGHMVIKRKADGAEQVTQAGDDSYTLTLELESLQDTWAHDETELSKSCDHALSQYFE